MKDSTSRSIPRARCARLPRRHLHHRRRWGHTRIPSVARCRDVASRRMRMIHFSTSNRHDSRRSAVTQVRGGGQSRVSDCSKNSSTRTRRGATRTTYFWTNLGHLHRISNAQVSSAVESIRCIRNRLNESNPCSSILPPTLVGRSVSCSRNQFRTPVGADCDWTV